MDNYYTMNSTFQGLSLENAASKTNRKNLDYKVIASGLTRNQARYIEQAYINKYGLQKNGGQLYNKINSIRTRR